MKIDVLTIFTRMFDGPLTESLIGKAREKGIVHIAVHDIRSFTQDKHRSVDDRPFGGGPGMVMKPDPIYRALRHLGARKRRTTTSWPSEKSKLPLVIYLSPQGKALDQETVLRLSRYRHLVLLCGHYEGVDERVLSCVDREISIGDYVLTGGELPAMVLVDSVLRNLPGVVKESASVAQDSFYSGLLDHPQYTRPADFMGMKVPAELMSGNHLEIERWRRKQALLNTLRKRPDLLEKAVLSEEDRRMLSEMGRRTKKTKVGAPRRRLP